MSSDLDRLVPRLHPFERSIFGEMSALANRVGAVNLGQGFPDIDGPTELKDIAIEAIRSGSGNQYPPVHGLPDLRLAISEHQKRFYGLDVDPDTGVVVATGASEALVSAIVALIDEGDEVIIIEPYFDVYIAAIAMARGTRVAVPLRAPSEPGGAFRLDVEALRAAAESPKAKMILINTPHNPTGMVLNDAELQAVADIAIANDLVVLSDEAYEHLYFAPAKHVPIATLPGMFKRTITVGSGGKCFSFTGWKVGWASGPSDLIRATRVVRQHLSYVSGGPMQPAIAAGLRLPDTYWNGLIAQFGESHDLLATGLSSMGFDVCATEGSYFIATDIRSVGYDSAEVFCRELPERAGVVAIPCSALSDHPEKFDHYVRWTFSKKQETINAGLERLATTFG